MATGTARSGNPDPKPRMSPAAASAARGSEFQKYIDTQVNRTTSRVKWVDLWTSITRLVIAVLAYLLVSAILDHTLPNGLDFTGRLLLLGGLLIGIGLHIAVSFVPLVIRRVNPVYAAAAIERNNPLKNTLINFLMLRRQPQGVSAPLLDALKEQAAVRLSTVPAEAMLDRTSLIRWAIVLTATLVVAVAYALFAPKSTFQSVERVLSPWSDIAPPTRVVIETVEPGNVDAQRDDVVQLRVAARKARSDDRGTVFYSTTGNPADEVSSPLTSDNQFHWRGTLPPGGDGLKQDVYYYVQVGDAVSPRYRLRVIQTPVMNVARIRYEYPAYTELPPRVVERQGDVIGLEGTKVIVDAEANQVIASAHVAFDQLRTKDVALTVDPQNKQQASGMFELALRKDRITPVHSSYVLRFSNVDGAENPKPVEHKIEVKADQPPELKLVEPTSPPEQEIQLAPGALLRITLEARDPDFKLAEMSVVFNRLGGAPLREEKLLTDPQYGPQSNTLLFEAGRFGLKPGDRVAFRGRAADNKSPQPNVVETKSYMIVIGAPQGGAQQPPPQNGQPQNNPPQQGPQDQNPMQDGKPGQRQPASGAPQNGNPNPQPQNPGEPKPPQPADNQQPPNQPDQPQPQNQPPPGQPQNGNPQEGKPQNGNSQNGSPQDGRPQQGNPQNGSPQDGKPQDGSPQSGTPDQRESGDSKPMPGGESSKTPEKSAGEQRQNDQIDPNDPGGAFKELQRHFDEQDRREGKTPEQPQPQSGDQNKAPQNNSSKSDESSGNPSQQPMPGEKQPGRDSKPSESQPRDNGQRPENSKPSEPKPGEGKPDEAKPGEGKPGEPKPGEGKPNEGMPEAGPSNEPKPGEMKPGESPSGKPDAQPPSSDGGSGASSKSSDNGSQPSEPKSGDGTGSKPNQDAGKPGTDSQAGKPGSESSGSPSGAGEKPGESTFGKPSSESKPGEQMKPGQNGAQSSGEKSTGEKPAAGEPSEGKPGEPKSGNMPGEKSDKPEPGSPAPKSDSGKTSPGDSGEAGGAASKSGEKPGERPQQVKPEEQPGAEPSSNQGKPAGNKPEGARNEGGEQGKSPMEGTPDPQEMNKPRDTNGKPQQSAGGESKEDGKSPSNSKHDSSAEGQNSGDRSGESQEGGGQKSPQKGTGAAGSNTPGEKGAGAAAEKGDSATSNQGGDRKPADGAAPDGKPGENAGDGSTMRQGGNQPGGNEKPGQGNDPNAPTERRQPGEPGDSNSPSSSARRPSPGESNPGSAGNTPGTGDPSADRGSSEPPPPSSGPEPGGDAANLEYTKKVTDLTLDRMKKGLEDGSVDPELIKRFGSREALEQFVRRWDEMRRAAAQPGPQGDAARREYDDHLKSLGLRPQAVSQGSDRSLDDEGRNLRGGRRSAPPSKYADRYRAYNTGIGRPTE